MPKHNIESKKPKGKSPVTYARLFVFNEMMHEDGPRLRRWRGDWYGWHEQRGCYVELSNEATESQLYRTLPLKDRKSVQDVRHALIAVDNVMIDGAELGSWLDDTVADPHDLAVAPNGLIDLPTGTLYPSTPRYFSTSALGVEYDPQAPQPEKWLEFLRELWPDDEKSIQALQEWFGYLLTPDTRQQKILLLVGPKRSGKGTIMRVLTELLGNVAAPTLASLGSNFGLWPLIGKSAAIIGDARLGGRTDIAAIVERLLSISGQDVQTIDRKHRELWTGYLSTRINVVSNELPRFNDASGALASRFLTLQLRESWWGKEDTNLGARLSTELAGILNWSIEGWRRLRAQGRFTEPESSAGVRASMERLASPVAAWIEDCCTIGPDHEVAVDAAYNGFRGWCMNEGQTSPSKEVFGRDIAARGIRHIRKREGERRVRYYVGLALSSSSS